MSEESKTDIVAQTYTIDCQGALGNMVKIIDEETGRWKIGHGISEVKVFGFSKCTLESR